jgi:hypothetical protein
MRRVGSDREQQALFLYLIRTPVKVNGGGGVPNESAPVVPQLLWGTIRGNESVKSLYMLE